MRKYLAAATLAATLIAGCVTTSARDVPVRIDSSSPQAAEASYKAMMQDRSEADQQKLALAVLMLNMQGVKSAHEVVNKPELQSPTITRIRQKVAGMTADEIIALAAQNPSVRVAPAGR
ncbi:DUF6694 family lipoprotein [Rhodanobacter sp. PCA2]|uniref:DUF6694 family lipoprotein n=1 Tax=Rhodanobacter sp. PCA2 TaxID=2006117 RepID=UPI0015E7B2D2|nr:DUF6694 family lipoprotein [Rhodanobacter sp. PCA2]